MHGIHLDVTCLIMQSRLGTSQSSAVAASNEPSLPPGWHKSFDDKHKQFYYYHNDSRKSQWEAPEWPTTQQTTAAPKPATLDVLLPQHAARASELEKVATTVDTTETLSAVESIQATATGAAQSTLDAALPEHAARAVKLEGLSAPMSTGFAQTTLDTALPEHATWAVQLEDAAAAVGTEAVHINDR